MLYGAAFSESYRARGVQLKFGVQLDGFSYSGRPILAKNGIDAAKGEGAMQVLDSISRGENIPPPGVREGPTTFFFGLGSQLGPWVGIFLVGFTVLLWFWWIGPRFDLRTLLVFLSGDDRG